MTSILSKAVLRALSMMLGERGTTVALYHLNRLSGFDTNNPDPVRFEKGVTKLYGVAGKVIMERVIEELYRQAGLELPKDTRGSLEEHLKRIRTLSR